MELEHLWRPGALSHGRVRQRHHNAGGQNALVEQSIIQRQTFRGASSGVAYPFSQTKRIEFSGGYQQVTFGQDVRTVITSLNTGQVISDQRESIDLADLVDLATTSAAAVFDTSVFGPVSPIAGGRSRFEVSPTMGTLSFTGALADYRRMFARAVIHDRGARDALRPVRLRRRGFPSAAQSVIPSCTAATTTDPSGGASASPVPRDRAMCSTGSSDRG